MPVASDLCTLLQQDLNSIARNNLPSMQRTPVGFLDALISGQNTNGFEAVAVDTADGKDRKVTVRYMKPILESSGFDEPASVCEAECEHLILEDVVECTTDYRTCNLKFSKSTMRTFCESPSEYRGKVIASAINAYMEGLNKRLIVQYVAKHGVFADATAAPKQIPLINQATSGQFSADFWGESLLLEDFAQLNSIGKPLVVGAGLLAHYANLQSIGCCNQYGQDISQLTGAFDYFRDSSVDGLVGTSNSILAWSQGAFQFISHLKNKGEFRDVSNPHQMETTIVDPITGIELDMEIYYDFCAKNWIIQLSSCFDLYGVVPLDSREVADPLYATNGGLRYQAIIS